MAAEQSLRQRQWSWLGSCLARNARSRFGQAYQFSAIRSIDDFRAAVPINDYADLKQYIDALADGQPDVLFQDQAIAFEVTSGTRGGSKLIPYSPHSLGDFQRAILPWIQSLVERYDLTEGSCYWALSPVGRSPQITPGGLRIGLPDAAYLGDELTQFFRLPSALPDWPGRLVDMAQWRLSTLYYLVRRSDLAFVSVWSPTFLLLLIDALDSDFDALSALLGDGGCIDDHPLPADAAASRRLAEYRREQDTRILWPALKLVSCWMDAGSSVYAKQLQARLPQAAFQAKGLLSTEAVVTVPDARDRPLLAVDSGFFEFSHAQGVCLGDELSSGESYEPVVTTSGGLYRYRTGDLVRCEGYVDDVPVLRFIGRSGVVSDLVGEKLDERFVETCLAFLPGFRMLLPRSEPSPHYLLLIDRDQALPLADIAREIETRLCANVHYAYARRLGQLTALQVLTIDHGLQRYVQHMTARGMRLGDVKPPGLSLDSVWNSGLTEQT